MDKKNLRKIIGVLEKRYQVRLRKEKPFEILIHGILSARTKDTVTIPAQERLFKIADTPQKVSKLLPSKIRELIYPVNYYIGKSKRVRQVSKFLIRKYGGKVPETREELMELPGVGPKIADLVLLFAYGEGVIPVDTHVETISKRWHIAEKKDSPEKVRENLHRLISEKDRHALNQLLVDFGKEICTTPLPRCYMCQVEKLCPYENKNFRRPRYRPTLS